MSTERKLLIATGSLIIAGMIAIAFFALGIYVGEQGWTLPQPSLAGPVPHQRRPGAIPNQGRPDAVPRAAQPQAPQPPQVGMQTPPLIGVVRRLEGDSLILQSERGMHTVKLDERTRYEQRMANGSVKEIDRASVQLEVPVAVFIREGHPPVAERVVLLPRR